MNSVCLVGRLIKKPELKQTASGIVTTTTTIAVDNRPDKNGQMQTDFISIVAWRNLAENLCKYTDKGSQIAVNGRISSRSYDAQDGTKRYVTEVVADRIQFIGTKPKQATAQSKPVERNNNDPFEGITSSDEIVVTDSDLPF